LSGPVELTISVDSTAAVQESNEGNNVARYTSHGLP
jgi:subtilase family serine protease